MSSEASTRSAHAPPPRPDLDWSADRARELGGRAVDLWARWLDGLRQQRVIPAQAPADVCRAVVRDIPDEGLGDDALLEAVERALLDHSGYPGHPRFLAYILGSGTVPATVGDLLASGITQNAGGWMLSPAAHEIERSICQWLAAELGLPPTAGGIFVTGGAIGNLVGIKLARDRRGGGDLRTDGVGGRRLAVYASQEGHDTVQRAADICGLGTAAVRLVPVDDDLRQRPDALRRLIADDVAAGVVPVAVVATAGTTGTGAIDPLSELATIAQEHGAWFHVDAAYGGPIVLADDLRPLLDGIEHADSVAVDPHKWLYTPPACGIALVRDERHLAEGFGLEPSYVYEDRERTERGVNAAMQSPAFSRAFDALKVWTTLLAFGRRALGERISHDAALARYLGARVVERDDFEPAAPVGLSICCFRYRPADLLTGAAADTYVDDLNRLLLTEVQDDGRVLPSNAVVKGRFALRVCITNVRTEAPDLDAVLDVTAELGAALDAKHRPAALRR